MLRRGAQVPDFTVTTHRGTRFAYSDIWQRKNLMLVSLTSDGSPETANYTVALEARMKDVPAHDTACIITTDPLPGLPQPGAVVADRWGEIHFVAGGSVTDLPEPDELIEWIEYVRTKCPECEGETR